MPRLLPTPISDNSRGLPSSGTDYASLANVAVSLLPTPTTEPLTGNDHARHLGAEVKPDRWGDYAAATARWEAVTGRPAPDPTEPNAKGGHRLSARFVEWLMGLPEGHVTDVPGMTRNVALKALGNGVVPQQCAAALQAFIEDEGRAAA